MTKLAKTAETKGKAKFSSQHDAVFRFSVTPAKIWLEQQTTKQQWQCTVSSVNDFALKGAGIPHAIVMDYLAMSLNRSESSLDTKYEVDLIPMSEGRMRLDFLLKFSIADVVWKPEYQFVLQPIEVTETQMLMAKLQDANDSLDRLHSIVPAWVGATSWLYVCGLVKKVLENSGSHVETAVEWSSTAVHKSTAVVTKYWAAIWSTAKYASSTVGQLVLDQYAGNA
ncbi:uncharacterized protein PITG_04358 [Phytophthora infestans T30-4]|uniref:Uncharacterized protein n=1 Tax=Phytophthora infestans (strain T30-4) TaxID=403677 RepID=D0N134_PHYIT|nr:uncharacterized protein PITG_04358 [Phytophthora infestans T30-4]EEY67347.1 conserved hypothetical protein [Phytophthora infestans T30-4]|eukprot:XP_002905995.1 conserved hypothetical protein [Phytophthora infestans T30-4]